MCEFVIIITTPQFYAASVEIIPLDRNVSRNDIECPGDIIPYNCSIQSNSEAVHLTWLVTLPGEASVSVTYPNGDANRTSLNGYITTFLREFRSDEFIHSTLEVTVQPDLPTDQIMVECSIGDLHNDTIIVEINTSSKYNVASRSKLPEHILCIYITSELDCKSTDLHCSL